MKLAIAVLLVGVTACGRTREARTHHVEIRAMQFVPVELVVSVGDTVVWTNEDVLPHTATAASFDSKDLASKAQWSYKVTAAGDYNYVCTYHPTMRGRVSARVVE
jgi:plastocyanin